jgi:hypothetical protein
VNHETFHKPLDLRQLYGRLAEVSQHNKGATPMIEPINPVPEVAFRKGFHQMVHNEMARECQAMLAACPSCEFEGLEAGKSYCYKPSYGEMRLIVVGEVSPKRAKATVSINGSSLVAIYRGNFHGTFIELSADLRALTGITHEMIVAAAVAAKLDVPPLIRRQYPDLFVEIPERFAQPRHSAAERVKNALNPAWVLRTEPVGPVTLDGQIEEAHRQIAILQDTRCQAVVANPDIDTDYDRYIAEHRADIDFYRWLRRQVDIGGVFYIPVPVASPKPTAA